MPYPSGYSKYKGPLTLNANCRSEATDNAISTFTLQQNRIPASPSLKTRVHNVNKISSIYTLIVITVKSVRLQNTCFNFNFL